MGTTTNGCQPSPTYNMKMEANHERMLKTAEKIKNKANGLFKDGQYEEANENYQYIVHFLKDRHCGKETCNLIEKCMSNCSLVAIKMKDFDTALRFADKILEMGPENEKILFRKGEALLGLKNFYEAKQFFKKVLVLNPDNKLARKKMISSKKKYQKTFQEEKLKYEKMF